MNFYIVSDLYEAGKQDDGTPFIAERFFVQGEDEKGYCLRHEVSFDGAEVHMDEEGYPYFEDVRDAAKARALRLCNRIMMANKKINSEYWYHTSPAYGSIAYQEIEAEFT